MRLGNLTKTALLDTKDSETARDWEEPTNLPRRGWLTSKLKGSVSLYIVTAGVTEEQGHVHLASCGC